MSPVSEILLPGQIAIEDFDFSQIVASCVEEDPEDFWGSFSIERGIFGGWSDGGWTPTTWNNRFFNQLQIDPYSCFYMANWTALANNYDVDVPFQVILDGWHDLVASGAFTPHVGGKMTDGSAFAAKHFNAWSGKKVQPKKLPFSQGARIEALKAGSNYVFGLNFGAGFAKNEQDDWEIQNTVGTTGGNGHLVCGCKENNTGDNLGKYAEDYHGVIPHEIILVNFDLYPKLFMNNLIYFVE